MRRFDPRRQESGFTLIELLISMTILGSVLTITYAGLQTMQTSVGDVRERLVNLDEARVLMATLTKDLRTAARLTPDTSPFTFADERHVTFYANISATQGPNKVDIFVDSDDRLVEQVTPPSGTAPNYTYTAPPSVRVVGSFISNEGPLFTYLYFDPVLEEFLPLEPQPLSESDLLKIEAVEVTISISSGPRAGLPTTLINQVRLPNVNYNPLEESQV